MKLADKIITLRKKVGWSQEELADKMEVSRQSVSKWESAASIPDLNKILRLAEIFSVSTDYLLKDDIEVVEGTEIDREENVHYVGIQQVREYIEDKIIAAKMTARGVLLCIYAVVPMLLLLSIAQKEYFSEDVAAGIGVVVLFLIIAVAVVIFISTGKYQRHVETFEEEDFELEYGVESIIKEELEEYKPTYFRRVSIAVMMFILAVLPLIISGLTTDSDMIHIAMVALLLGIVGLGVFMIIPVSTLYNSYECILGKGDYAPKNKEENKMAEKIGAIYWPIIVAIYLGWSLYTMDWGTTWVIWPVAAVFFAAVVGVVNLFDENPSK